MRARIVVSMLVIALAAAMLGGATFAWFTGEATQEGLNFTAGNINIGLIADADLGFDFDPAVMAPGDSFDSEVTLANIGNLNLFYKFYFEGTGALGAQLDVTITSEGGVLGDIYNGKLSGLIGEGNAIVGGALLPHTTGLVTYRFEFSLPTDTDDTYQNASFSGDFIVKAVQSDNNTAPEWTN